MKDNIGRKLVSRTDVFIILILVILCVGSMLFLHTHNDDNLTAVISIDGKVFREIDLSSAEDEILTLKTTPQVTLEIKNHKIRFINSLCPDKTCEKAGFLEKNGDTAACVPGKVVVSVVGDKKQDVDVVVG